MYCPILPQIDKHLTGLLGVKIDINKHAMLLNKFE